MSSWTPPSSTLREAAGIDSTSRTPHRPALAGVPRHPACTRTLPFCAPHRHAATPPTSAGKVLPHRGAVSHSPALGVAQTGAVAAPHSRRPARPPPGRRVSLQLSKRVVGGALTCAQLSGYSRGRPRPPRSRAVNSCFNSPAGASFSSSAAG